MREKMLITLTALLSITLVIVLVSNPMPVKAQENGDLIVSGNSVVIINQTEYECRGRVIVKDNGTLIISECEFVFNTSSPGIFVMDNGTLIIDHSDIDSIQAVYPVIVNSSAHLQVRSSRLFKLSAFHTTQNAMVSISESQLYISNDLIISGSSNVAISDSMVSCAVTCYDEANITFKNVDRVPQISIYDSVVGSLESLSLDMLQIEGSIVIRGTHLTISQLSISGGSIRLNSSNIYTASLTMGNMTLEHSEASYVKLLSSGCSLSVIRSTISNGIYIPVYELDHLTVKVRSGYIEEWHSIENIFGVGVTPTVFIYHSNIESWMFEVSDNAILEVFNSSGVKIYGHGKSTIMAFRSYILETSLRESAEAFLYQCSTEEISAEDQTSIVLNESRVVSETIICGEVNVTMISSTTLLGSNNTPNIIYHVRIYSSNVRLYRCNIKFLSIYSSNVKIVNSQVTCLHNHMSNSTVILVKSNVAYNCKCLRVEVVSYTGVKIKGAVVAVRFGNVFVSNVTDENGYTILEFIPVDTTVFITVATEDFSERVQVSISECSSITIEVGPPRIINIKIHPERPTDKLNTTVTATLYDPSGINYVKLMYKAANEASWNTVYMSRVNDTTFAADIPPYPVNTVVKFYIIAEDACGQWTTSDEQIYVVSPSDLEPPLILKVYWENIYENETIILYCKVYDENGIMRVVFHYRIGNGPWFNVTGTIYRPNVYKAEIPGQKAETKIQIYVEVWDTYYNRAVSETYTVTVKARPIFTSLAFIIPLAMVAAIVIVLIVSMLISKRRESY